MTECTCPYIHVGMKKTDSRNWSPKCLLHGIESEYWNSEGQKAKRKAMSERTIELQRLAREAALKQQKE